MIFKLMYGVLLRLSSKTNPDPIIGGDSVAPPYNSLKKDTGRKTFPENKQDYAFLYTASINFLTSSSRLFIKLQYTASKQ